ncbi:MAG: hypothetical protein JRE40_07785 [Deltaproteobacteria bacterium]|nr:hypothetical protein [Deltaproteobacteria bacterium]
MKEIITNNADWIFSGIGVFILSSIIAIIYWIIVSIFKSIRRSKENTEKRIEKFISEFRKLFKNDGVKLDILVPAGINSFKNDKEIKLAFKTLMEVVPGHPLRGNWKTRVEKIGYKRFFSHIVNSGRILDKYSIESFLRELE